MKSMKSAKIYHFPHLDRSASSSINTSGNAFNTSKSSKQAQRTVEWKLTLHWSIGLVWLSVGLLWPFINWLGAMDVLFQWLRALYYSNTPALHATLQAELHTACYLLLSAFVYLYRPKVI